MILIAALIFGALLGWRRATQLGGNTRDRVQYAVAYALGFAAAGLLAAAVGQTPCARLCRLYFEGTRLCGSVLALYFFITFLSTALLLLAGNGGFA